jgi:hypothetical protein
MLAKLVVTLICQSSNRRFWGVFNEFKRKQVCSRLCFNLFRLFFREALDSNLTFCVIVKLGIRLKPGRARERTLTSFKF